MGRAFGCSRIVIGAVRGIGRATLEGRVATPANTTGTTTFLASKDGDRMTGQIVMVDGGMALA